MCDKLVSVPQAITIQGQEEGPGIRVHTSMI